MGKCILIPNFQREGKYAVLHPATALQRMTIPGPAASRTHRAGVSSTASFHLTGKTSLQGLAPLAISFG